MLLILLFGQLTLVILLYLRRYLIQNINLHRLLQLEISTHFNVCQHVMTVFEL